jgi:diaminopimelate epimerase
MNLKFIKMHGCGNDYIYFDCLSKNLENPETLSIRLSDRHFGVGGDGIVLICPSNIADAKMRMFNADGSEGKMCGNAIRCVGKYLFDNKIVHKDIIKIETLSGIKILRLKVTDDLVTQVTVDMGAPILNPSAIPVLLDGEIIINKPITVLNNAYNITCVSMGNPHAVIFVEDVDNLNLEEIGPAFENHSLFPERTNTEFVEIIDNHTFKMRVWERGSGETLACGTGACASTVAAILNGFCNKKEDIKVLLKGGILTINYDDHVYMTGPAERVFEGEITLKEDSYEN